MEVQRLVQKHVRMLCVAIAYLGPCLQCIFMIRPIGEMSVSVALLDVIVRCVLYNIKTQEKRRVLKAV